MYLLPLFIPDTSRKPRPIKPLKGHLTSVPLPPRHTRPSATVFTWGSGSCGQLGLGTATQFLGELSKPRLHDWFELVRRPGGGGLLGLEEGSGVETVATGGMHTLAIDEVGKVCSISLPPHIRACVNFLY